MTQPQKPGQVRVLISNSPSRLRWKPLPRLQWNFSPRLRWGFIWVVGLIGLGAILTHYAIAQVTAQSTLMLAKTVFAEVLPSSQASQSLYSPQINLEPRSLEAEAEPLEGYAIGSSFGHLPYSEMTADRLMVVASYSQDLDQRFERLTQDAGLALMKMLDAARLDGVWLVPVSGFRDAERQDMLFRLQVMRDGSRQRAARAVAPPGHSEHHTGYAIDLADGLARAMDLNLSFGQTDAYRWLSDRAHEFGFELSFPENNSQGVNYEPWHWRFVGTPEAAQTFAAAHRQHELPLNSM